MQTIFLHVDKNQHQPGDLLSPGTLVQDTVTNPTGAFNDWLMRDASGKRAIDTFMTSAALHSLQISHRLHHIGLASKYSARRSSC